MNERLLMCCNCLPSTMISCSGQTPCCVELTSPYEHYKKSTGTSSAVRVVDCGEHIQGLGFRGLGCMTSGGEIRMRHIASNMRNFLSRRSRTCTPCRSIPVLLVVFLLPP